MTTAPDLALTSSTVARLLAELGPAGCPDAVAEIVRECFEDLRGSPAGALPELVERLARVRLSSSPAES
ncbi:hypothetical protein WIS52_27765 [Pseudonocardia nematodicida]|uniref:Uncharacterized protein n=1 Tax=Pseudonocardia nematodicida TaxID=1206997 RepID=A0ABV1KIK5_9PSEU